MEYIINKQFSDAGNGIDFKTADNELEKLKTLLADVSSGRMSQADIAKIAQQLVEEQNVEDYDIPYKHDFWAILVGSLPAEAIVDYVYMPTYCVCAILMRAYLLGFEAQVPGLATALSNGLEASTHQGFVGHGYRRTQQIHDTIKLFILAGLPELMVREPDFCPSFQHRVLNVLLPMRAALRTGNTFGAWGEDYKDDMIQILSAFPADLLRRRSRS